MTKEFTVDVSRISPELQTLAERDIRWLAALVAAFAEKRELPFLLQEVRLTTQFSEDVNDLLLERWGTSGYAAHRDNVLAYGTTIWVHSQQEGHGFIVLVDANLIGPWSLTNPWCLVVILHELSHVLYEARALKRLGEEGYMKLEQSRESLLEGMAKSLIDEYDVDCLVNEFVKKIATKDNGQPWSLREIEEAKGLNWVETLITALEEMPPRIEDIVMRYRTRRISIDCLEKRGVSVVQDFLILLSHTAAMYMDSENWPAIFERLGSTEASRRFLKDHVRTILDELTHPTLPFETSLQNVAHAIEDVFRHCGITFKTVPEGMYIAVDLPDQ